MLSPRVLPFRNVRSLPLRTSGRPLKVTTCSPSNVKWPTSPPVSAPNSQTVTSSTPATQLACARVWEFLMEQNVAVVEVVVNELAPMLRRLAPQIFDNQIEAHAVLREHTPMYLSDCVLGTTATKQLADRATKPVLAIGRDRFTRGDLARVGCFNFNAAARLHAALTKLVVRDTRDFFERYAPAALAIPGIGAFSLFVLGAAFEAKGIGGKNTSPLEAWVRQHAGKDEPDPVVTFATMKRREAADARAEKPHRRRQAHVLSSTTTKETRFATAASR